VPGAHVIRRQVLEVELAGSESDGVALHRRLPDLCRDRLTPALDRVLERCAPPDEHWTIERLEVDAGTFSPETLERDLVDAVTRAIEGLLRERGAPAGAIASASPVRRRTGAGAVEDAFLHFLATGALPWWFDLPAGMTLEDAVRAAWQAADQHAKAPEHFVRVIIDAIADPTARKRLVRQFSTDFLAALLARVSPDVAAAMREALARLGDRDVASPPLRRFIEALWQTAFAAVAAGRRPTAVALTSECLESLPQAERQEPALRRRIAQRWPEALARRDEPAAETLRRHAANVATRAADGGTAAQTSGAKDDGAGARIDLAEGVFIRCAGLVLLHPFLPRLFAALGIAAEGRMLQPERAMCLLHFLATGQRVAPEYELLLPKLLCNVPFEQPTDARIELSAVDEEEAVALLQAVIRHWDALGDTSADGLRGTFLTRPGKLSRRLDGDDLLQVEARSFDILLDRLPWGIGMVKLPWMERILRVEWSWQS